MQCEGSAHRAAEWMTGDHRLLLASGGRRRDQRSSFSTPARRALGADDGVIQGVWIGEAVGADGGVLVINTLWWWLGRCG